MITSLAWLVVALVGFRLLRAVVHRLLVVIGFCRYHSPLLYTSGLGPWREIHLGTTVDFLSQGDVCRRRLLARLAEGLLALCDDVERGRLGPNVALAGTTDLLRDGTARRLGFHTSSPSPLRMAVALTAWTQISLLRTVLRRGPALVKLQRLRRLRIRAGDLVARRTELQRLRDRLALGGLPA